VASDEICFHNNNPIKWAFNINSHEGDY